MGNYRYVCHGCQTETNPTTGEKTPKDKIRDGLNSRGTAETLARIHAIKTGHTPVVQG